MTLKTVPDERKAAVYVHLDGSPRGGCQITLTDGT